VLLNPDTRGFHLPGCNWLHQGAKTDLSKYERIELKDLSADATPCFYCAPPANPRRPGGPPRPEPRVATRMESDDRGGAVMLGRTIHVLDEDSGVSHTWTIVKPAEADAASGKLSAESPVGRAILGHGVGETVTLSTPRASRRLTVEAVDP
jgi:Transcription elongation factor, GreA/GreB, C-term